MVRRLHEDVLDVRPHLGVAQHLVALVDHEELALNGLGSTFSNWMSLCLARS